MLYLDHVPPSAVLCNAARALPKSPPDEERRPRKPPRACRSRASVLARSYSSRLVAARAKHRHACTAELRPALRPSSPLKRASGPTPARPPCSPCTPSSRSAPSRSSCSCTPPRGTARRRRRTAACSRARAPCLLGRRSTRRSERGTRGTRARTGRRERRQLRDTHDGESEREGEGGERRTSASSSSHEPIVAAASLLGALTHCTPGSWLPRLLRRRVQIISSAAGSVRMRERARELEGIKAHLSVHTGSSCAGSSDARSTM